MTTYSGSVSTSTGGAGGAGGTGGTSGTTILTPGRVVTRFVGEPPWSAGAGVYLYDTGLEGWPADTVLAVSSPGSTTESLVMTRADGSVPLVRRDSGFCPDGPLPDAQLTVRGKGLPPKTFTIKLPYPTDFCTVPTTP